MIDLRSDLLTVPTPAMWEAMRAAELGWASIGEDPSVRALERRVAGLLGKEAGLFVPTCGLANLVALLTLCEPGDAVVLEAASHVLTSEAMGIVEVARLDPHSLWAADGRLDPRATEELVRTSRARLLVLENTHTRAGGTVLSVERTEALALAARRHGCRVHLDGARLANAAVALGVPPAALAAPATSVALSLNKGLGAPFGAVLAGGEELVRRAGATLHRLGAASVHRAGLLAAAALVALDDGLERLADDHRRARELGELLGALDGLRLDPATVETNILLVDVSETGHGADEVVRVLERHGVRVLERDGARVRLVTHRLVGDAEVAGAAAAFAAALAELGGP